MGTRVRTPRRRRILLAAAAASIGGLAVLALLPRVFGAPRPIVYVAWHEMPASDREALERRLSLTERQPLGPREFAYVPGDTATATLAAMVAHPAVLATEGIDRRTATISATAPLTARRGGAVTAPRAARAVKAGGALLLALGVALAVAGAGLTSARAQRAWQCWTLVWHTPAQAVRRAAAGAAAWLQRGVPAASPEAGGLFRIVFVSCALAVAALEPAAQRHIPPADAAAIAGPYGVVVQALAANPSALRLIDLALWVCGALAVAGLATRIAFAGFAGVFVLWACVFTTRTTLHAVSALQVTLLCLLAAPWGDAWSLDAWLRRRRATGASDHRPSRRHGFAMWVPGFVLGVAYLAAAWAKIGHGPDWVLNGTVRQHFLTDLDHAWISWGPGLTAWPAGAIALSAGAIAIEALAVSAAFVPSWRYRLAIGGTVLSLLAGFALFQGIVWPGWWVLLLGFLPWQLAGRGRSGAGSPSSDAAGTVTATQLAAIAALLLAQLAASIVMRDFRPFVSGYDMYATTHGPEIENTRGLDRVRVVVPAREGWRELPACAFDLPADGTGTAPADRRGAFAAHLRACLGTQPPAEVVRLDLDRQTYDWSSHALLWRQRVDVAGPFRRSELPDAWPFGP